jgi:hypothetical protein
MSKAQEISELAAQAGELVDNLKSLKERAGHYADATAALAEARAGLSKLVDETSRLAVLTHQTLHKLDQLGVASIIESLEALGAAQRQVADQAQEQNTKLLARLTQLDAAQKLNRNLSVGLVAGIIILLVLIARGR